MLRSYHAEGGEPAHHQPQPVEQEVEVDVVADEEHHAVTEQPVTLRDHNTGDVYVQSASFSPHYNTLHSPFHPLQYPGAA